MGQFYSTVEKPNEEEKLNNIGKLFNNNDDTDDILESLNLTEFKVKNQNEVHKKPIPMIGGRNFDKNDEEKTLGRKRYTKYDLFKILKDIDSDFQKGGEDKSDIESSLNDDKSMEHIKDIILKELENLKKKKSQQVGGSSCGCDGTKNNKSKNNKSNVNKSNVNKKLFSMSNVEVEEVQQNGGAVIIDNDSSSTSSSSDSSSSSSDVEAGKKKSKKSKPKVVKKNDDVDKSESDDTSRFFIETSESGKNNITSNGEDSEHDKKKSKSKSKSKSKPKLNKQKNESKQINEEDSEGLSIFPFNSSDVKSSLSVKNYRMLRRKI